MRRRSYESDADVALLQAFNAESIASTGGCGYTHPGDIPHRLFNGNKYFEPAEVMTLWEDRLGVAAWVLVGRVTDRTTPRCDPICATGSSSARCWSTPMPVPPN
jgi:hypothetical protein